MNKNEKIIMGILVGGIVLFLALSIFVLFGKSVKGPKEVASPTSTTVPTVRVLTTPYPTIPPIADFYMQVNEKRFYPETVNITKGHTVTILNIGKASTTLTSSQDDKYNFGKIEQSGEKEVTFNTEGVYRYTRTGKPNQVLTITVR